MDRRSMICAFKKIDVGKSEVIKVLKRAMPFWAVLTQTKKGKFCLYGLRQRQVRKEDR